MAPKVIAMIYCRKSVGYLFIWLLVMACNSKDKEKSDFNNKQMIIDQFQDSSVINTIDGYLKKTNYSKCRINQIFFRQYNNYTELFFTGVISKYMFSKSSKPVRYLVYKDCLFFLYDGLSLTTNENAINNASTDTLISKYIDTSCLMNDIDSLGNYNFDSNFTGHFNHFPHIRLKIYHEGDSISLSYDRSEMNLYFPVKLDTVEFVSPVNEEPPR